MQFRHPTSTGITAKTASPPSRSHYLRAINTKIIRNLSARQPFGQPNAHRIFAEFVSMCASYGPPPLLQ